MTLHECLHPDCIIEIRSRQKVEAIAELVKCLAARAPSINGSHVQTKILEKEALFSSVIREGVAIPHVRIEMADPVLIAIGRSERGVDFFGDNRQPVHLIVLLLTRPDKPDAHLEILKDLALILDNDVVLKSLIHAPTIESVRQQLFGKTLARAPVVPRSKARHLDDQITDLMLKHGEEIARSLGIAPIFVNCDSIGHVDRLKILAGSRALRHRIIPVFKNTIAPEEFKKAFPDHILQIPEIDLAKAGQIKMALFLALSRKWIKKSDVILYLLAGSDVRGVSNLDVIVIRERYDDIIFVQPERFRSSLNPVVLQQLLKIAIDLSINGREGRKIGTLFVAGDHENVMPHTQQLVVNPFRSVSADEAYSILDPTIEEMVKELAQLDGAFIIGGEGQILTAGTNVGTGRKKAEITKGLGARHQAAANISAATRAIAVTVSETNGAVTVFQGGRTVFIIEPLMKRLRIRYGDGS